MRECFDHKKRINKIINCCILICVITCCFFSTSLGNDVENVLEIYPGVFKKIKLPYKYKFLSEEEKGKTVFLWERCYTILEKESRAKFVIIGPLSPCIGVGLYYNQKAVIAHLHYSSDVSDFINKSKKELGNQCKIDPKKISGFIYTCRNEYYYSLQQQYNAFKSFKNLYEDRTQDEEVKKIKAEIMQGLDIADASQIKTTICDHKYKDEELGWFQHAETSILVELSPEDRMEVYNICMFHEELFWKYQNLGKGDNSEYVLSAGMNMPGKILQFIVERFNNETFHSFMEKN